MDSCPACDAYHRDSEPCVDLANDIEELEAKVEQLTAENATLLLVVEELKACVAQMGIRYMGKEWTRAYFNTLDKLKDGNK